MESELLIKEWLLWHRAVEYIKHDLPQIETVETRIPVYVGAILRHLGNQAYRREQEAFDSLRANGIRITKEKVDRGEVFIVWSYKGNVDILSIEERKLQPLVQQKVDELISDIAQNRKGPPQA